jgi:hypothetical protein
VFAAVVEVRIPVFEAVESESEVRLRIGGLVRALEALDVELMSNWLLEAAKAALMDLKPPKWFFSMP